MATDYIQLKDLSIGNIVKIRHREGGYGDYIVVHHNYATVDGKKQTLLLSRYAIAKGQYNTDSSGLYSGSVMDFWMQAYPASYLNIANERDISDYIPIVNVSCQTGFDGTTNTSNYARKVFALSATEVGVSRTPEEGQRLSYFSTGAASKRVCSSTGDTDSVTWFLRTPSYTSVHNECYRVKTDGSIGDRCLKPTSYWYRPAFCLPAELTIQRTTYSTSTTYYAIPNTPPSSPRSVTVPSSVIAGSSIAISWTPGVDAEQGVADRSFELERSVDNGQSWQLINTFSGTTSHTTDVIPYGLTDEAKYRIREVDSYAQKSDFIVSQSVSIVNNTAPSTPASIYTGSLVRGRNVTVGWGQSNDAENNLVGYTLERSTDGQAWTTVYTGMARTYTGTIGANWEHVAFRVSAFDAYDAVSGYATTGLCDTISPVSITIEQTTASHYRNNPTISTDEDHPLVFSISNTDDPDFTAGRYDCVLYLDNVSLGQIEVSQQTVNVNVDKSTWQQILNGDHTFRVDVCYVTDRAYTGTATIPWKKNVSTVEIELEEPITNDDEDPITRAVVNVTGQIPNGCLTVQVTNNANDDTPVWQTVASSELNSGAFFTISNTTVTNGNAFSIKVTADRGNNTGECYIDSINGMVGENIFELINSRLRTLEEYHA